MKRKHKRHYALPPAGWLYCPKDRTRTYVEALFALDHGHIKVGLSKLLAEPANSPCRCLALGNAALIKLRMEQFTEAEKLLHEALMLCEKKGCPHPPSWVQFARNLAEAVFRERTVESLQIFNGAVWLAQDLQQKHPAYKEAIIQQEAHTFSSWGGALIYLGSFEAAIDCFEQAGDIYRKYPSIDKEGEAERLLNYALALTETGEKTKAFLALNEARDISRKAGDLEHLQNIEVAMIQLDFDHFDGDLYQTLERAAKSALDAGKPSTCYVRHCIRASIANSKGDYEYVLEACDAAMAIEDRLNSADPSRPRLRGLKASALSNLKREPELSLQILLEAGKMWWNLLGREQWIHDVKVKVRSIHDHCRLLSKILMEEGRDDESCMAFEAGRALSFALDVDPEHLDAILAMNPFEHDDGTLSCQALRDRQKELSVDQVFVGISLLPGCLATYVVGKDSVEIHRIQAPDMPDPNELTEDILMIPTRLHAGTGLRAIPSFLFKWAEELATLLGGRRILAIAPNSFLHSVPWRALLRHAGLPWRQLASVTRFGLLLPESYSTTPLDSCIALSKAEAGENEIAEEAANFARHFATRGKHIPDATSQDVRGSLIQPGVVLISCHGKLRGEGEGVRKRLFLELREGAVATRDLWSGKVNADMVILSACDSGVYEVAHGDYPLGAAPDLLRAGAKLCLGTRFPVNSQFAAGLMNVLGNQLARGTMGPEAFANSLSETEAQGFDLWKDLACFELIG